MFKGGGSATNEDILVKIKSEHLMITFDHCRITKRVDPGGYQGVLEEWGSGHEINWVATTLVGGWLPGGRVAMVVEIDQIGF